MGLTPIFSPAVPRGIFNVCRGGSHEDSKVLKKVSIAPLFLAHRPALCLSPLFPYPFYFLLVEALLLHFIHHGRRSQEASQHLPAEESG